MVKRLLIDASHAEETRMVVLDGNRIEDFDVEVSSRRQIRGNIYLAKVVRVEPSLQAAFVDYGGNRHGFLAFSEIHPDYYQIPVADREKLLAMQAEAMRTARAEDDFEDGEGRTEPSSAAAEGAETGFAPASEASSETSFASEPYAASDAGSGDQPLLLPRPERLGPERMGEAAFGEINAAGEGAEGEEGLALEAERDGAEESEAPPMPETVGGEGDDAEGDLIDEEARRPQIPLKFLRQYKIQEVIHRRQIMLVQVVKEERGNKGAALTTYISLPGRYCVLMPNALRGGGISRKITSPADRKRLREVIKEIGIPEGMSLIVRTAGANRPKEDIKRDCEYLLRLWDEIRETTLRSIAPALIYEDASLIKRAIRDIYMRDIDEVIVDGESGFREAREMMRLMTPAHVNKVSLWRDAGMPLFARYQIEQQLEAVFRPVVPLRSGGYIVINQTEALVAIDVNSGRATRERNVEDTALRTNLEAAEEIARQIRLRDLGGLIVIDFIDMDHRRHNIQVERRLKEALKQDRARIQVGSISAFGLLEMSRQRIRPSLVETSLVPCPHCGGLGHVRSTESAAVHVLRLVEEEAARRRAAELVVHAAAPVVLYIFNTKRNFLNEIEARFGVRVSFEIDPALIGEQARIERKRGALPLEPRPEPVTPIGVAEALAAEPEAEKTDAIAAEPLQPPPSSETEAGEAAATAAESERRRRRRRRRRPRREDGARLTPAVPESGEGAPLAAVAEEEHGSFEASPSFAPSFDTTLSAVASADEEAPRPLIQDEPPGAATASGEEAQPEVMVFAWEERIEARLEPSAVAEEDAPLRRETEGGVGGEASTHPLGEAEIPMETQAEAGEEAEKKPKTRRRRAAPRPRRSSRKGGEPATEESAPVSSEAASLQPQEAPEAVSAAHEEQARVSPLLEEGAIANASVQEEQAMRSGGEDVAMGRAASVARGEETASVIASGSSDAGSGDADGADAREPRASVPITPIVVGVTPVPERKRGWWRRG